MRWDSWAGSPDPDFGQAIAYRSNHHEGLAAPIGLPAPAGGVLVGAVGLIALRSRAESSADVPWGWPEAMVLLIAVPVVVAGLWILARRFDGRS